jgi:hypothetical protein
VWGAFIRSGVVCAAAVYSWMRPPSRSCLRIAMGCGVAAVWRRVASFGRDEFERSVRVGCLYSIGGAGGGCPSREKPLETDACGQSTGPQQSRQRSA